MSRSKSTGDASNRPRASRLEPKVPGQGETSMASLVATMAIVRLSVDELLADPANCRKHDRHNLDTIKASLAKFGQQKPIVVGVDNVVIAGNGTLVAANELAWTHLECVRSKLTGAEAMAYAIADNRTAELASWDFESLATAYQGFTSEAFDIASIGFASEEIAHFLPPDWDGSNSRTGSGSGRGRAPGSMNRPRDAEAVGKYTVPASAEELAIIERAIYTVRQRENDEGMSSGRALSIACGHYLESQPADDVAA